MSHDRGAFGQLLATLTAKGGRTARFTVDLHAGSEDQRRWEVVATMQDHLVEGRGRTGEEALRRLVELLGE